MAKSKNPKPKALRHAAVELPELPGDPWLAPWPRREPGPTQLPSHGLGEGRRRRHRPRSQPRPVDPSESAPE